MFDWIKYIRYDIGYWSPTTLDERINVLLRSDKAGSNTDGRINVCTTNITHSIELLEVIASSDYHNGYAFSLANPVRKLHTTYLSKWYSNEDILEPKDKFVKWLKLVRAVNRRYLMGLKCKRISRAYSNSIAIRNIIKEADDITNLFFK